MNDMARMLIIGGLALAAVGIVLLMAGKIPGVGKLPGDILIKKENFTFYFPLTTCILLSFIITAVMYFIQHRN